MKHIRNLKKEIYLDRFKKWSVAKNKYFPNSKIPNNKKYFGTETFSAEEFLKIYNQYGGNQN